jgi:hypothetical protein
VRWRAARSLLREAALVARRLDDAVQTVRSVLREAPVVARRLDAAMQAVRPLLHGAALAPAAQARPAETESPDVDRASARRALRRCGIIPGGAR